MCTKEMAEDYPPWLMSPMSLEKPSREMITSDGKTTRALMQGAGDDMATRERAAESAAGGHECVSNQKKNPGIGGNPDGNRGTSGDALLQHKRRELALRKKEIQAKERQEKMPVKSTCQVREKQIHQQKSL